LLITIRSQAFEGESQKSLFQEEIIIGKLMYLNGESAFNAPCELSR